MNDKIYLAALHKIGINQKKLNIIFEEKQNYKEFYENINSYTLYTYGFNFKQIEFILKEKSKINFNHIVNKIKEREVKIITRFDDEYPSDFLNLSNIPFIIYIRGKLTNKNKLAFIGSRKITSYGKNIIEKFLPEVGKYFEIVSGGAAGVDTYSHKISLDNKINTISVIGTGIDLDYPTSNKKLFDEIVYSGGAIVSIFPIGEVGNPYNFPIRNELVACLSKGIIVVEAREKSGSLITAKLALDLGKDVFSIPGDILRFSSTGCNKLISSGEAKAVFDLNDILEEYNISFSEKKEKRELVFNDEIEEKIYNLLLSESFGIDKISEMLKLDISTISFKISMMEINNIIRKRDIGTYEII